MVEEGARANENEKGFAQGVVGAGDEDSSAGGRDCGWESAERGFYCVCRCVKLRGSCDG